jgi:lipoprotein-anchoring transpeptidase ErfK/SrfK
VSAPADLPVITFKPVPVRTYPRPVESWMEAQIALARHAISCGPIDGVPGAQSAAALAAFQKNQKLPATGLLDDDTRAALVLTTPPLRQLPLSADGLDRLQRVSPTWLGKSQQTALAYETALEFVAEQTHSSPAFIARLNPSIDWTSVQPGTIVSVPNVDLDTPLAKPAMLHVRLADHILEARDAAGALISHFPVSIAKKVEKRPVGELHVAIVIADPDYTFDPVTFPESEEAQSIGHKLIIPPGPNNPVGVAWIGLDRTGYGIHGTPLPENVGRTESHGCFRLANWDARTLLSIAYVGLPVIVEP